ncbi:hypothetical protein J7E70_07810 [Variovorax paradoxus]|nr:hypothetical protein [Variovorax paradoxus]MBT2300368.1 hypothetical protein [Variovorax paradoxus]
MGKNVVQTATGGVAVIDDAASSVGSMVMALTWNVARGATNTVTVGALPANARIIAIWVENTVVHNAATTATVSVGLSGGTATYFTAAQDIKTAIGNFSQAATVGWTPATTVQTVTCTYTETGTASTTGTATVGVLYAVL